MKGNASPKKAPSAGGASAAIPGNRTTGGGRDRNSSKYTLKKRLPFRGTKLPNDIYVTRKSNFVGQLDRCQKLLDTGEPELYIHGLGAAINRAVHLALRLKAQYHGSLDLDVETGTETLIDDLTPEVDHLEPRVQTRFNSAIHIRVFRPAQPVTVNN